VFDETGQLEYEYQPKCCGLRAQYDGIQRQARHVTVAGGLRPLKWKSLGKYLALEEQLSRPPSRVREYERDRGCIN
jgi:hypothetical protein